MKNSHGFPLWAIFSASVAKVLLSAHTHCQVKLNTRTKYILKGNAMLSLNKTF